MLVRLKESMGYTTIDGYRIYGRCYGYGSFGPTKIPRDKFFCNKDILEEAEVTGRWLSKKTGKNFPDIRFYTTKMHELDLETVIQLADLLDIEYIRTRDMNKNALSATVVKRIEDL